MNIWTADPETLRYPVPRILWGLIWYPFFYLGLAIAFLAAFLAFGPGIARDWWDESRNF